MIGELIFRIRKDRHMTKAELARSANVNLGYIGHIEKEERTPSHKALKKICASLDVPYQQIMYTYDKETSEEHKEYDFIEHIAYNSIPAINNVDDLIFCPTKFGTASVAIKINDTSMEPTLTKGSYAYTEFNSPLNNKDIGLFYFQNKLLIRRFIIRSNFILLKSDNSGFPDVKISNKDDFYIVGKILGTNTDY